MIKTQTTDQLRAALLQNRADAYAGKISAEDALTVCRIINAEVLRRILARVTK